MPPVRRTPPSPRRQTALLKRISLLILLSLLLISPEAPASAREQRASAPQRQTWVTDGPVMAIAAAKSTIYLGGLFTSVGPSTGSFVLLDAGAEAPNPLYPGVIGTIYAVASDGAE